MHPHLFRSVAMPSASGPFRSSPKGQSNTIDPLRSFLERGLAVEPVRLFRIGAHGLGRDLGRHEPRALPFQHTSCQFASNRDPSFASNRDPCWVMDLGLSP